MEKTLNIISNKIPFTVRLVEEGDAYGFNNCKVHKEAEPLIEFYDQRYSHTPFGQFVSRYNLTTLQDTTSGLNLDGGIPDWKVSKDQMDLVRAWMPRMEKPKTTKGLKF